MSTPDSMVPVQTSDCFVQLLDIQYAPIVSGLKKARIYKNLEHDVDGMSPATGIKNLEAEYMRDAAQRIEGSSVVKGEAADIDCNADGFEIKVHHLRIDGADPLTLFMELLRKL